MRVHSRVDSIDSKSLVLGKERSVLGLLHEACIYAMSKNRLRFALSQLKAKKMRVVKGGQDHTSRETNWSFHNSQETKSAFHVSQKNAIFDTNLGNL